MKSKALISAVLVCLILCSCGKDNAPVTKETVPTELGTIPVDWETNPVEYSQKAPLICSAESEEEAKQIAGQYGIRLVEYSYGVASFYTEEDPTEVIRRGLQEGWTELSLNQIHSID